MISSTAIISPPSITIWAMVCIIKEAGYCIWLRSSIFINPNVSAEVSFSADPSTLPLRTPISANARLTHSGTPLANADDYQEYTCTLYVQDDTDPDKEWPVEMFYDSAANAADQVGERLRKG